MADNNSKVMKKANDFRRIAPKMVRNNEYRYLRWKKVIENKYKT